MLISTLPGCTCKFAQLVYYNESYVGICSSVIAPNSVLITKRQ
uniref:Uncharacterized protein n=1 Tax=Arundo donax TaxID=35708 RepID=A0A0A9EXW3_ARUDO